MLLGVQTPTQAHRTHVAYPPTVCSLSLRALLECVCGLITEPSFYCLQENSRNLYGKQMKILGFALYA